MDTPQSNQLDLTKAYRHASHHGIAWRIDGFVMESVLVHDYCEDDDGNASYAEWEEVASESQVRAHMVGDDKEWILDIDDLQELDEEDYCGSCGQIGCPWH